MISKTRRYFLGVLVVSALFGAAYGAQPEDAAVERTRKQVRMLNDLYRTAFVLITANYVSGPDTLGAGAAITALFDAMKNKGWHEARLLDATGSPLAATNSPQDAFERLAIKTRFLSGIGAC